MKQPTCSILIINGTFSEVARILFFFRSRSPSGPCLQSTVAPSTSIAGNPTVIAKIFWGPSSKAAGTLLFLF